MFALLEVLGIYSGLSLVAVYGIWRGIRDLSAWTTQTLYQQGTSGSQLRWSGRNRLPRRVLERKRRTVGLISQAACKST
jgi:hypothetical protein